MNRKAVKIFLILFIIGIIIFWDQESKAQAREHLKGQPEQTYLNGSFKLTYAENTGAFLSLGANESQWIKNWSLKILPSVLLCGLLAYIFFSEALSLIQVAAYSLLIGGGGSNIFDRLTSGRVTDFLNMGIGSLRSGIFNFADVAILFGFILLLSTLFKK